jgi:hypothetical protein
MAIYSLPPPSAFKTTMKMVDIIISNMGEDKNVLTVPLPRYVLVVCCDDTSHVSNRQDFLREISGSEKCLSEAAAAGKRTAELTTVDRTSIWTGDGVHLTSNATRVAAMKMMAYVIGGETAVPASKRARLESVIPVRSTPPPGGQTRAACAAAQACATPALAVRPAAGQSTRQHAPPRSAARGAMQQPAERRPARAGADGPAQGRKQGRAPRRPTRPLGPLVKPAKIVCIQKKFERNRKLTGKKVKK